MRRHWIIVGLASLFNLVLLLGLWLWAWRPGIVYVVVLAECLIVAISGFIELAMVSWHRRRTAGLLLGIVSTTILCAVTLAAGVLAAYYCWIVGIELDGLLVAVLILAAIARYGAESVLRPSDNQAPSTVVRRTWTRALGTAISLVISGGLLLLGMMTNFPFTLPEPGGELFSLDAYRRGIEGTLSVPIARFVLSVLIAVKYGLEVRTVRLRQASRAQWGWADRIVGQIFDTADDRDSIITERS